MPDVLPIAMQPWSVTDPAPLPVAPAKLPVAPMIVSLMSRNCGFPGTSGKLVEAVAAPHTGRPLARATDFGALGKVTFKAVATLVGVRDALPADNTAPGGGVLSSPKLRGGDG